MTTYKIQKGDTLYSLARKYGMSLKDLQNLNKGVNANGLKVGQNINVNGKSSPAAKTPMYSKNPNSYKDLWTPDQIRKYSESQSNNKYVNEKLGYDQNIARYNKEIQQLLTDKMIQDQASQYGKLKYDQQILDTQNQVDSAETRRKNSVSDLDLGYTRGLDEIRAAAGNQRARSAESVNARGLATSSIFDNAQNQINQSEISGTTNLSQDYENNVYKLNNEIDTLVAGLNKQKGMLTKQQQEEIASRIDELTKQRNDQKDKLKLEIEQQNQLINQARNNQSTYTDSLFHDMFDKNQDRYDQRSQFNEQMRQKELDRQNALRVANAYKSNYSYQNSATTNKPYTPKPTSTGYDRNNEDAMSKAAGTPSPTAKLGVGMGPISDNTYHTAQGIHDYGALFPTGGYATKKPIVPKKPMYQPGAPYKPIKYY